MGFGAPQLDTPMAISKNNPASAAGGTQLRRRVTIFCGAQYMLCAPRWKFCAASCAVSAARRISGAGPTLFCVSRALFCAARSSDGRLLGLAGMCVSPTLVLLSRLVVLRIGDANQRVRPGLDGFGEFFQVFRDGAEI